MWEIAPGKPMLDGGGGPLPVEAPVLVQDGRAADAMLIDSL
jgi:hypothetical protein